ncbi:uncharacterized protein TNCV_2264441 [Trichonephila clavipes]|nr:uncharacterized protein TNCV_2264441 [Trichonephila clavipes]
MEVTPQHFYVPNCIERGWYTNQRSQTVPRENTPDHDGATMPLYSSNLACRIHGTIILTPYSQPPIGVSSRN